MTGRRGQASIESLIAIVFALFVLVMVALLATQKNNEGTDLKVKTDAKRVATSVADNINMIAEQGSGFYRYFSIPEKLYGDNEYSISINGSLVEIDSGNYTMLKQMITSNVTVACLDKGLEKKNKVYSDQENITIICNLPELMITNNSFRTSDARANATLTVSVDIISFGPVDAGPFTVRFNDTIDVSIPLLRSEEKREVFVNMTAPPTRGPYPVAVRVDFENNVTESIESNNFYNGTINVA